MATAYAQSLARQIREDLAIRLSALGAVAGVDASGNPTIAVGAGTAGSQSAFVRVTDYANSLNTDSLGNAQKSFGPHLVQIVLETSTIAAVPLMTLANLGKLLGESLKHSAKIEVYLTANTVAVTVAGITGVPALSFDKLYFPLTASM